MSKKNTALTTTNAKKPVKKIQFTQSGQLGAFIEEQAQIYEMSEAAFVRKACHIGLETLCSVKITGNKITSASS